MSYELLLAAEIGDLEEMRRVILDGADVNYTHDEESERWPGVDAVDIAAKSGSCQAVKMLIDFGASNRRFISEALVGRMYELVSLWIHISSDVNVENESHGTALHEAASLGDVRSVEMLLEAGADPYLEDRESGMRAVDLAEGRGHFDVAKLLRAKMVVL